MSRGPLSLFHHNSDPVHWVHTGSEIVVCLDLIRLFLCDDTLSLIRKSLCELNIFVF